MSNDLPLADQAFARFVMTNKSYALNLREAIALTVIDLIDMECDPKIVHETANRYRKRNALPIVTVPAL